jgi:serine/threonine protein kinase
VTILNNDVTLTAVGRMQTTLFWVSIALSLLTAPRPERRTLPLPAGSAVSGDGSSDDPSPQLAWADVETGDLLGQGSFAAVYAARWRGSDVALKCFLAVDEAAAGDEPAEARALAEAQLLIALRHPNVLHVYGLLPRPRALVMERGACTLQQLLRAQGATLRWRRRCELARGIAAGVEFLHAHTPPVIHGDLSCSNILLATSADDAPPKLADFGTSFVSRAGAAAALHACCAEYAAPEVVRRLAVALPQAVDAFAFGVVVHRIATARGEDVDDVKQAQGNRAAVSPGLLAAMRRVYAAELAGFQPAVREGAVPPPLARLVSACCAVAPQARPAFAQLRPELEAAMGEADEWPPPVAEGRWD